MLICNMNPNSFVPPLPPTFPAIGAPPPPPLPPPLANFRNNKNINNDDSNNSNAKPCANTLSMRSKSSTTSQGFRLQEDQGDTGSVYSIYKQKIDSMFESDSSTTTNKNSVQARIEKMFDDVARDSGIPAGSTGVHVFSVDYLGSVPLQEKVTSLTGLQDPLRELYFAYKKNSKHKKPLTGRLEISHLGLKVQYQGGEKGGDLLEQLNSFPTIAVWSAVKFVIVQEKRKVSSSSSYAFLPLITDPDNIDKKTLFRSLEDSEKKYINAESHSPLFAVVMRKIGIHKQLECHGFVCQTSEDAIVIAATLYKSLMAHMKLKENRKPKSRNGITCMSIASSTLNNEKSSNTPVRPPRKKRSTTSSVVSDGDVLDANDTQPLIKASNKPPKKSIKSRRAPKAPDDLDAIVPYEEPTRPPQKEESSLMEKATAEIKPKTFSDKINTYMSREQKQITAEIKQVMSESNNRGLRHVQNVRKSVAEEDNKNNSSNNNNNNNNNGTGVRKKENNNNSGDILTKVTIPRSGSFLNAGGLTRYKSKVSRNNGQATGGSPLGFSELFNEFRLQEGLHSMDEILGVIIDPEGMSFNDLKPIYKEFLLKLSVTLTKDELYQRSKSIMRRQKKKQLKRKMQTTKRSSRGIGGGSGNKFKRLKHIFRKNLKLKLGGKNSQSKRSSNSLAKQVGNNKPEDDEEAKLPESSISTSSYDTRHFTPKKDEPLQSANKKHNQKKKFGEHSRRDRLSTSEESDFFSMARRNKTIINKTFDAISTGNNHHHNRNSSSGYVSCSECSYDSDTCTCISADKCYCSLGGNKNQKKLSRNGRNPAEKCDCHFDNSLTFCDCDTDSCAESNKCYCQNVTKNNTILDQLKKRGLKIPQTITTTGESQIKHRKLCKKLSNSKSTRSLEYMHNPVEAYYDKLNLRAQSVRESQKRRAKGGSYGRIAANSIAGRPSQMNQHQALANFGFGNSTKTLQSAAVSEGACTEALSVKKSAEIAALFADIKLSQTTDIAHLIPKHYNLEAVIASKNAYNRLLENQTQDPYFLSKKTDSNGGGGNFLKAGQKMVQNALYIRNNPKSMYSTKNGLYTIQSQSDESGRSSVSQGKKRDGVGGSSRGEYYDLDSTSRCVGKTNNKGINSNLENSLGYLP